MRTAPRTVLFTSVLMGALTLGVVPVGAAAGSTGVTKGASTGATATTLPVAGSVVKATGITRTILSVTQPANAPGEVLYLTRVRIAPKAKLAEHFHDGTQVASVQSGVLTYRITSGTVTITARNGTSRTVTGPRTVKIRAGESLVEGAGLTHYGSNATSRPVTILTAALIAQGAGLSTPVGTGATGETLSIPANLTVTQRSTVAVGPQGERTAGTLVEAGQSSDGPHDPGAKPVRIDATIQVTYTNGSGPFTGLMTWSFGDGSTLVGRLQGATVPTADGGASFAATVGIIGGTGSFSKVTGGTGTYTGSRSAAVGAPLTTVSTLTIQNG